MVFCSVEAWSSEAKSPYYEDFFPELQAQKKLL